MNVPSPCSTPDASVTPGRGRTTNRGAAHATQRQRSIARPTCRLYFGSGDRMTRFRNLDGSGPNPGSDVFRWAVVDKITGRRRRSPASAEVPAVKPDLTVLRNAPAPGEPARLTWIGHASWLVQIDGASLLIDPVFSKRISR